MKIDWAGIETVFLDAGNTLVTMDYTVIASLLADHGIDCDVDQLARAEAASRPLISRSVHEGDTTESRGTFARYVATTLANLPAEVIGGGITDRLITALVSGLHGHGRNHELWCRPIPGVRIALETMAGMGLQRVVVSNSDGTAARSLTEAGIEDLIETVVDSHHAGYIKPDPRLFHHALSVANARPETTLHVGDLYHVDVLGARAAGITGILVDPYGDWPDDLDCPVFTDVGALAVRLLAARSTR